MRTIKADTADVARQEIIYNSMDTMNTFALREVLMEKLKLDSNYNDTYWYLRNMLGPIMTMMRRGIKINETKRTTAKHKVYRRYQRLQALLNRIARAIWKKPLNPASPKQMVEFFRDWLSVSEADLTSRKKGEAKITTDSDKLDSLSKKHLRCSTICKLVIKIRETKKELESLDAKLLNGRMMTSYNLSGTETLRLSSSEHPFWCGCVSRDTEVLTKEGWIRFDLLDDNPIIAVWDKNNNNIFFDNVKKVSRNFDVDVLTLKGEQVSGVFTMDHKHAYKYPSKPNVNGWLESTTKDIMNSSTIQIPLSGFYNEGIEYDEFNLRLMVACLADGSLQNGSYRLAFSKDRKIKRFINLCNQGNILFNIQKSHKDCSRFSIKKEHALIHLTGDKYGKWLLDLGPKSRAIILDELKYWDASIRNKSFVFFSKDKDQCEWLQICAHLTGISATVITSNNTKGYNKDPNATITRLNVKPRSYAYINSRNWTNIDRLNEVFCVQTSTGFFLIRHDGKISITGNCNAQNIDRELRHFFVPDDGYTLCECDQQGAEAKAVAYLSGDEGYIKAVESEDVHTYVAHMSYGIPNDRAVVESTMSPNKTDSYRQLTKKTTHGTNYYATPWTVAQNAKITIDEAENFQAKYFKAFPGIKLWQTWHSEQLTSKGFITNSFGFKRRFWDRPTDDSTLREAIANCPQSMIGIITNIGLYRLWLKYEGVKDSPLQILANGHDALVFQVKTEELKATMTEVMPMITLTIDVEDINGITREMTIPMGAKVGPSWGKKELKDYEG